MSIARGREMRGQTMVEVGLILPIFLITLLAIIEFGYWAAVAAATSSASREGARYGSTVGETTGSPPTPHYIDCDGIRDAARSTTDPLITLADGDVTIEYDDGLGSTVAVQCISSVSRPDEGDLVRWNRVVVTVEVTYDPIVPILDLLIGTHELVSTDRRSIVKSASP